MEPDKKTRSRFWAEEAKEIAHKDIKGELEKAGGKKGKMVKKGGKKVAKMVKKHGKKAKKSMKHVFEHALIR